MRWLLAADHLNGLHHSAVLVPQDVAVEDELAGEICELLPNHLSGRAQKRSAPVLAKRSS